MSLSVRILSDTIRSELNKYGYVFKSNQREYNINTDNIYEFVKLISTLQFKTRLSMSMTIKEDDLVMKTDIPLLEPNKCPCCGRKYE